MFKDIFDKNILSHAFKMKSDKLTK